MRTKNETKQQVPVAYYPIARFKNQPRDLGERQLFEFSQLLPMVENHVIGLVICCSVLSRTCL